MSTEKLYKENVYCKKALATVLEVTSFEAKTLVSLDKTIFFPTGGGQSCDTGTIGRFAVTDVYERDDQVLHQVECDVNEIRPGDVVELVLDWEHRFDNMQRHCGEHIFSGMFFREFGGVNRGFHMGEEYMTIDISLEEPNAAGERFEKLTWEMVKQAELCANEAIWADAPVVTRHFDKRADAEKLPLRKALAFDEDITIVCVGSIDNPSDCVACCGTHPSGAGQVGMIKAYKVEPNKGMFRVYFEAGRRAFLQYQEKLEVLTQLEKKLSAGTDDVLSKFESQQEKNKATRDSLYRMKKLIMDEETRFIKSDFALTIDPTISQDKYINLVRNYEILSVEDLLVIGRSLIGIIPKLLIMIHKPSKTVLLFSNGQYDCNALVKDNAPIYNGKGGGNKEYARAIFPKLDYIETFVDLLDKHLR